MKKTISLINKLPKNYLHKIHMEGVLNVTPLFSLEVRNELKAEALHLTETAKKRSQERKMYSVSTASLLQMSTFIKNFYFSPHVRKLLEEVTKEKLVPFYSVSDQEKGLHFNILERKDDQDEWHLDINDYVLVLVAEAPRQKEGGLLQIIPNAYGNPKEILKHRKYHTKYYKTGTFYLMKGGTSLHRVTPLLSNHRRISVVFRFQTVPEQSTR